MEDFITYEFKPEQKGHRTYKNGEKGMWHYGVADKTTISLYSMVIKREAKLGGQIVIHKSWGEDEVIEVAPCPTGHANVGEDFMGGSVCRDCRAVW